MAGTIDLGEVKVKTAAAKKALEELDSAVESVGKGVEDAGKKSSSFEAIAGAARSAATVFAASAVSAYALTAAITAGAVASEQQAVALRGLGANYQQVRIATNGAVTAAQAFEAQNRLTQSGLRVSGDQLATLTRAAREFALRTGTDTTAALQQLTGALVAGDAQGMRPFGINVQVGTLRTQAFRQALGQLQTAQSQTSQSAETLAEAQARLGRAWESFRNDTAAAVAETLSLKSAFSELADALESLVEGGPLVHNFFDGILSDITGIQNRRGTAEDRTRNADQLSRERVIGQLQQFQGIRGIDTTGFNANALSGPAAERLSRALRNANGTPESIQAAIDEARGVTRQSAAARTARLAANGRGNASQNSRDDYNERTRNMSAADWFQLAEDQSSSREQLDILFSELRQQGFRPRADTRRELEGNISGFLDPAQRRAFQRMMTRYQRLQAREQRLRGLDPNSARMGLSDYEVGGSARGEFDETFGLYGAAGRQSLSGGTISETYGSGLTNETYRSLLEADRGKASASAEMGATVGDLAKRNNLSVQLGSFFSDTQTLAEKGSKGFENAFNTMSGAVSGFIDTLIEGQVPAGEAAVGLAKAALKGLAMQAVPEALFETAKGFAALAMGSPTAALHFTAAGIYAGVAVAAGAGAAGIGAAQRSAQHSAAAGASVPAGGATSFGGSSGGSRDNRPIIINVNGAVMDREGFENAVLDGVNGAIGRGGRMSG